MVTIRCEYFDTVSVFFICVNEFIIFCQDLIFSVDLIFTVTNSKQHSRCLLLLLLSFGFSSSLVCLLWRLIVGVRLHNGTINSS